MYAKISLFVTIYALAATAIFAVGPMPCQAVQFTRNITIGMTLTLSNKDPLARVGQGIRTRDGILYWYENIPKGYISVGSERIGVNLVIHDDKADPAQVRALYTSMANDSSIDFLIGPVNSDYSMIAKSVTEPRQKLLIGTSAATSAFYLNGQWSFAAVGSARYLPRNAFAIMRIKSVKTVAIVYDSASPLAADACLAQPPTLAEQGLKLVAMLPLASTLAAIDDAIKANISGTVEKLKAINPDAVLECIHAPQLQIYSLEAMKAIDWAPKMVTVLPDSGGIAAVSNVTKNGLTVVSAFDATAQFGHKGSNFNDSYSWGQAFIKRFGYEPDSFASFGSLAPLLLQLAIEKANTTTNTVAVRDAFRTLDVETFVGRITFASDGANQNSLILQQWQNGERRIIAPPLFATAEPLFPLPQWNERVFSQTFGSPTEIAVIIATSIAVIFSIVLAILLIIYRNHSIIIASSPTFLGGILLGSFFLYASNYASLINNVTTASCHLQAWLLALGFIIMFGSLFAKSWRVYRLYSNSGLNIIKISDLQVFLNILIWVLIMVVLLIIMSIAGNLQSTYVSLDPARPFRDYYTCMPANQIAFTVMLSIILAYCGAIILVGLFVAYKVRAIPFSVYDESRTIAFSMYNVSFFVILLAALRLSNASTREVLFMLQSFGIILCSVVTLCTMLFAKASYIQRKISSTYSSTVGGRSGAVSNSRKSPMTSSRSAVIKSEKSTSITEAEDHIRILEGILKKNNISFPAWKAHSHSYSQAPGAGATKKSPGMKMVSVDVGESSSTITSSSSSSSSEVQSD